MVKLSLEQVQRFVLWTAKQQSWSTSLRNLIVMATVVDQPELDVSEHPIVFFDGVCGLCDHTVKRLLKLDKRGRLRFAPLQGETAKKLLDSKDIQELKSLVFYDARGASRCSTAVVRILWTVGGIYRFAGCCLWLIPSPLRNSGYRFVSHFRYRWFGRHEACRLPQPGERERFLP